MENPESQRKIAEFVQTHKLEASVPCRVLDLVAEVGELAKVVLTNIGCFRRYL
jgi:NTP pyrophosphatase (non-canonical NTP hydrolase)